VVKQDAFSVPGTTKFTSFVARPPIRPQQASGLYSQSPVVLDGGEGRIAQGESASLTRKRSEVQILVRPQI
jgi:hypothetical protein